MSIMNITESEPVGRVTPCASPNGEHVDQGLLTTSNVASVSAPPISDEEAFAALALLSPANYDRVRKREAKRLDIRVETLDSEVARVRAEAREEEMFQSALSTLRPPELSTEPVIGSAALTQVAARFRHYLVLPLGAADAFTLWTAHTHAFAAFVQSPRLNISSPEPGCGKTTALDLIATLAPRPLRTESLTAPVLFRLVDQFQPTLLLDEADAWLPQAEELRGLLNAGHKRGACAYRCDGEGNAVRPFRAFGPAALAGIGSLPGTLHDRSICIPLVKAEAGQIPARFDDHRTDLEKELCRQLARWAADNFDALKSCEPVLPPTAFNRLADNWRPLFAIAQIVGGDWPERALQAFNQLTRQTTCASALNHRESALLAAIGDAFRSAGTDRLTTKQLLAALQTAPKLNVHGLVPRSALELGRRLAPYGIESMTVRAGKERGKGYYLADFPAEPGTRVDSTPIAVDFEI